MYTEGRSFTHEGEGTLEGNGCARIGDGPPPPRARRVTRAQVRAARAKWLELAAEERLLVEEIERIAGAFVHAALWLDPKLRVR